MRGNMTPIIGARPGACLTYCGRASWQPTAPAIALAQRHRQRRDSALRRGSAALPALSWCEIARLVRPRRAASRATPSASQALGRGASFDPQADPIVRVEAGRLRRALARYYGGSGPRRSDHDRTAARRLCADVPRSARQAQPGGRVSTPMAHRRKAARRARHLTRSLRRADRASPAAGRSMAADVESARQTLDVVRELLAAVGSDAGRRRRQRGTLFQQPDQRAAGVGLKLAPH